MLSLCRSIWLLSLEGPVTVVARAATYFILFCGLLYFIIDQIHIHIYSGNLFVFKADSFVWDLECDSKKRKRGKHPSPWSPEILG